MLTSVNVAVGKQPCGRCGSWSHFALMEPLAVIAIISILAALLFPVLRTAKRIAKQVQRMSNEKQIGVLTEMYAMG